MMLKKVISRPSHHQILYRNDDLMKKLLNIQLNKELITSSKQCSPTTFEKCVQLVGRLLDECFTISHGE